MQQKQRNFYSNKVVSIEIVEIRKIKASNERMKHFSFEKWSKNFARICVLWECIIIIRHSSAQLIIYNYCIQV